MAIPEQLMTGQQPAPVAAQPVPSSYLDLYPQTKEEYDELFSWTQQAFQAAEQARFPFEDRWSRYYKMYRSYIERKQGDWRSAVFIPIVFWIIETNVPRMVAQLPEPICAPVGPDDVMAADTMEELLKWATQESNLHEQLVAFNKSALIYGTGILKTFHKVETARARRMQNQMAPVPQQVEAPVVDPDTGQPMLDMDGNPVVEKREEIVGYVPAGVMPERYSYNKYDGPAAECVDIWNFWPAPEAPDVENARYVIHRVYREMSYIKKRVAEGVYRWPDEMGPDEISDTRNDPKLARLDSINLGGGDNDSTRKPVELMEYWTDDGRVITVANRKAILRVQENPFDHGEKPFVRAVDYPVPWEFWGVGEIEPLEGLQDVHNALVNQRIDAIRLTNNPMYAVNWQNVEDLNDLQFRPGGIIRLKGDLLPQEVLQRQELGDVNQSAFQETEILERTIEKVSAISAYQMGLDSPSLNDTATGVAIIQEQGASRFGLKSKMAELQAYRRLFNHFGSILQQFTTEERVIRIAGPNGALVFRTFDPASLQGALDYDIESDSTTQTETVRREQKMTLLQLMADYANMGLVPPQGVIAALEDVLDTFNVKDKARYLQGMPATPPGMDQMMGQIPPVPDAAPPPEAPGTGEGGGAPVIPMPGMEMGGGGAPSPIPTGPGSKDVLSSLAQKRAFSGYQR